MDLKNIRKWGPKKMIDRLSQLNVELDSKLPKGELDFPPVKYPESVSKKLDEAVIILLEILSTVSKEKGWKDQSSLEMFEAAYDYEGLQKSIPYEWVMQRFRETRTLVTRYKESSKSERARISAKMISRGML